MAKVVYISELDFHGSGYSHITIGLCSGLARRGHDVKVLAFTYKGEEHEFPFSVIPVDNPQEIVASFHNCAYVWKPDVVIVALDIPFQERFIQHFAQYGIPYIAITPLESDPLTMSWAMALMQARKNLSAAVKMISKFRQEITEDFRYVLVTRQHLQIGWNINDMLNKHNVFDKSIVFDRMRQDGISFKELWAMYAAADCFLLTSKGEGAGLPILEAMSVGVPVVATDTGAITEHIERGGGWLMEPEDVHE